MSKIKRLKKQGASQMKWRTRAIQIIYLLMLVLMVGCQNTSKEPITTPIEQQTPGVSLSDAYIHFIDTGNSDAILIEQGEHAALIDGGDNDDETLVADYIQAQGITRLDYVFATHPDADHIGGLDGVISKLQIGQVLVGNGEATTKTYKDFIESIMNKGLSPSVPLLGKTFELGDGSLKILSVANEKDVNNCSLVILYTYGDSKVLLMGDADQSIEKRIDLSEVGDVDLIKVGHHGSKTSSNEAFIKAVSPEYAVITCGKGNKYGHPDRETLDMLNKLDISIYRTDEMGDIIFKVSKQEVVPEQASDSGLEHIQTSQGIVNLPNEVTDVPGESSLVEDKKEEVVEAFKPLEQSTENSVYFTANGKTYHKDASCSNMKEPISGTLDEVGERTPCKKCYG
ncbi:MAG: MBL fold metallo-hydrolase [Cellulosilyticum sp.]|nr:MBL fold metallo-hydrolase [Cellulosilyticum sp.]